MNQRHNKKQMISFSFPIEHRQQASEGQGILTKQMHDWLPKPFSLYYFPVSLLELRISDHRDFHSAWLNILLLKLNRTWFTFHLERDVFLISFRLFCSELQGIMFGRKWHQQDFVHAGQSWKRLEFDEGENVRQKKSSVSRAWCKCTSLSLSCKEYI